MDLTNRKLVADTLPVRNPVLFYDESQKVFWTRNGNDFLKESLKKGRWAVDTVLHDTEVTTVLGDSEGNTWFGTNGNGLYKYFVQDFDRCASERIRRGSSSCLMYERTPACLDRPMTVIRTRIEAGIAWPDLIRGYFAPGDLD